MSLTGWVFIFLSAFSAVAANLLLRLGIENKADFTGSLLDYTLLFKEPAFNIGLFFYGFAMVAWVKVLSTEPLNVAYPILSSITFALVTAGASLFFNESLSFNKIFGIIILIVGITIIARG